MDISTITALIGGVKTATELAKAIKDSGTTLEAAEVKLKLADLISALADVKMEAATVQTELLDAQEQIRKLEAAAKQRAALVWRQPCYWLPREADGVEEPYCQPCFDGDGKLSRLNADGKGGFRCMVCSKYVQTNERTASDKASQDAAIRGQRSPWSA